MSFNLPNNFLTVNGKAKFSNTFCKKSLMVQSYSKSITSHSLSNKDVGVMVQVKVENFLLLI